MTCIECPTEMYHMQSTIDRLRVDVDALLERVVELEGKLADETRRRRTLTSRFDSREWAS